MAANQGTNNKLLAVRVRSDNAFIALLVLAFLSFGFIGIVNHEMWLDELQAWVIARDSSSVIDLFKNLRYEGHPALWHIGLYLISRFTHDPFFMQVFHLLLATISIYIFARSSPFTRLQKVIFSFGYFPAYEYGIISRNYALGVLLFFCFCALFRIRKKSYFLLSCILFFLANTNVYGLIIAISLGMTLIFECLFSEEMMIIATSRKWNLIISVFVVFSGIVISIFQIIPPSDSSFAAGWRTNFNINHLGEVLLTIVRSYIPIPNFFTYQFWNTNIFTVGKIASRLSVVFSLGLLTFGLILFARTPVVFFLYITGNLGILLFTYVKVLGWSRHWGHLFILFIACLWISNYYSNSEMFSDYNKSYLSTFSRAKSKINRLVIRYKNKVIMAILYTHLAAGIFAFTMDLYNPFSETKEVANFIHNHRMEDILIVGDIDYYNYVGPPLSAYLNKKVYYLGSQKAGWGSFIVWNNKRAHTSIQEVYTFFEQIDKTITVKNPEVLLVLQHQLQNCSFEKKDRALEGSQLKFEIYCFEFKNLYFSEVSEFNKNIIFDENPGFYLYLVRHKQKS